MLSRFPKTALTAGLLAALSFAGPALTSPAFALDTDSPQFAQRMAAHTPPGFASARPLLRAETVAGHRTPMYSTARRVRPAMRCMVGGSPSDFPEDIMMTATVPISQGAVANWSIDGSPFRGTVVLPQMRAGQSVFVPHVLPGGLPAGIPCTARVIWH
ncbi:hypothetical protein JI664_11645 [Rhodobacter sp. NTK016B]|uniref:hypothetical protein n=1 Tax=Rhodobacter sp. NTK016B TaxID=2759676 RepID=UPI001A8F0781|nr:hypothetical protein [Rhodobacter sp. NTK016B]MBN8292617.1 hypothetical protein [Rhodobacter sp. NTK016B]